ncbi:small subunit processome component 20 homolog isoform X1 [Gadus morhua]|uniref:small subunit processome component 20 homolog isoform X1 n=1 Tax=Gadus morhua TaxID=8049 RepID=UPI0011B39D1C|nr:small subunit processome component 20 homolog isoform X1 [Gadus morhua]
MKLKSKSSYHKSENTYRFLTFAERLANVNIDVIHRIDRTGSYDEEVDTYFFEGLTKWRDLNLTDHFLALMRDLFNQCQTFNLLVFHQKAVVASLKAHLAVKNSMAYQPLLDLVVRLARDLQTDFYPHFPDFFLLITPLLETKDTEVLEWVFTCLSYLYKYLWRLMTRDMSNIYRLYSPLLAHKKEHICNFAAESFSFLMRKVPDMDGLLVLMLSDLKAHPEKAKGAGQLLFEMCKGVRCMFHSCAEKAFPLALRKLGPTLDPALQLPWDTVRDALDQMAQAAANHVDKEHFLVLWESLQACVMEVLEVLQREEMPKDVLKEQVEEQLERLLFVLHTLASHKDGAKVTKPQAVCQTVMKVVRTPGLPASCSQLLLQITSSLLLGENIFLPFPFIQETVQTVFASDIDQDLILEFTKEMFTMKQFEKLFLPTLLRFSSGLLRSADPSTPQRGLEVLVQLILSKAPPPSDGSMAFEVYPLLFTGAPPQGSKETPQAGSCDPEEQDESRLVPEQILSLIQLPLDQPISDLSLPWAALVLLPHLRPLAGTSVVPAVTDLLNRLLGLIQTQELGKAGLFVARQALSCLLTLDSSAHLLSLVPVDKVVATLQKYPTDLSALLLGDLYYTRLALGGLSEHRTHNALLEVYQILHANVSSNIAKIRLLTLRIFTHFAAELPVQTEGEESEAVQPVFAVCLQAERVPATVQDYREKLLHLRKLRHDLAQGCLPQGPPGTFQQVPLRYLIAMLYINFKSLWDPIIELLVSHARGMDNKSFWQVFYEHLQTVAGLAEKELQRRGEDRDEDDSDDEGDDQSDLSGEAGCDVIESGDVGVLFLEQAKLTSDTGARTDFTNFRTLLWRAMTHFPDCVEPRSRELTPLFLQFISNEYFPADLLVAPTQDLRKKESPAPKDAEMTGEGVEEQDSEEEEEEEEEKAGGRRQKKPVPKRAAAKQLISHMKVFAKFSNPRSLYMEPRLNELYHQLLCHHEQEIQKAALDCILTYRDPHIVPYKENLGRLLDDKHFKEEIVHFNISEEGEAVDPLHRVTLIPLLMRILFGRLRSKGSSKFQGKASASVRSSIVLRFLGGCQAEELGMFISLLLEPLGHHAQGSCVEAVERAVSQTDVAAVLPLGRQHSLLNVITVVIDKLGHLIQGHLPQVLQIILSLNASNSAILDQREQLKPGCIAPLKKLRRLGGLRVLDFFEGFESYAFTSQELDAIFLAGVWPQVCRLSTESPYSPTPLLKLIHAWSKNPRFFPLMAKRRPDHPECDVLLNVFSIMSAKKISQATTTMVLDIAESLITSPDFVATETMLELNVNGCVVPQPPEGAVVSDGLPLGSKLLLPHVSTLLVFFSGVVSNTERTKRKKNRTQVAKELSILSKISRFVNDKEQSSTLITLLLPYLHRGSNSQDTEMDILATVQNLLRRCLDPSEFLAPLSKLFSIIMNKLPRMALTKTFLTLSEMEPSLDYITDVTAKLNAFDSRHLDEIHFDVRLIAFQDATRRIEAMTELDMPYINTILNNCFYTYELSDMSLSDNATLCMMALIAQLAALGKDETYKEVVQKTLLEAVHKGLRSKADTVRHEYTTILACLVKTFPTKAEFRELVQLTDYNDPESDFFEHMKHIQIHRRGRALRKLAKQLSDGVVVMSSRSLQSYIMPYTMTALFDPDMIKHEAMTSAGTEMVAAVCSKLTWSKYLYYLRQFIHVLQTGGSEQKLAVSLLVTVLEAFHFEHKTLTKEMEAAKAREAERAAAAVAAQSDGQETAVAVEDEEVAMETDGKAEASDVAMETDEGDDDDSDEEADEAVAAAKPKKKKEARADPVASGLPKNKAELESLIRNIHKSVQTNILPRLHKCLTAKVKQDDQHKSVKSKEFQEEEVVRIPLAFAMVKLLNTLPKHVMEANLPGILLKVCVLLRNRYEEVREVVRGTLVKMIQTLGPRYLLYLLTEMQSVLNRGYQVHVLTYTVYQLLAALCPTMKSGQIDHCIPLLLEIFNNELFGDLSEEKEVKGIVSKLMEARHSKSMMSYELVGQYCGKKRITQLILPLKEILEASSSVKVCLKVGDVMRRMVVGLLANQGVDHQDILLLSHALVSQSLPLLTQRDREKACTLPPLDPRLPPPSCLLLLPTPTRGVRKAAVSSHTNLYILVDTGLKLLYQSLRSGKVSSTEPAVLQMLDPFVPLLLECLTSMHVKVTTEAMITLTWLLRLPLPAVKESSSQLNQQLFLLLKDYSKAGAASGENYQLVQSCFRCITVLVKSVKTSKISDTQLQVLLGYAEEDIYDQSRQATAFSLLKAILSRKLVVPEMEQLMSKVAKLAVSNGNSVVRMHSRQIYQKYLLDYPLGKKLSGHLEFIVAQLSYEHDTGRLVALEMLEYIFQTFPQDMLTKHSGLFLAPLALVMLNDDSASCKRMAALDIKVLLSRLDLTQQNALYSLVQTWMAAEKANLRRLGAQVCGLFVEVEGENFARRLDDLLPIIEKAIHPDNYEDMEEEETEKGADRLLFSYLTLVTKLIQHCHLLELCKPRDTLDNIWRHIEAHLRYPHSWVWLTASQLFGQLFASQAPQGLVEMWKEEGEAEPPLPVATAFLCTRLDRKMRECVLSFSHQLLSKFLDASTGEQIIKNLIFVAKTTYLISPESEVTAPEGDVTAQGGEEEENEEEEEEEEEKEEEEEEVKEKEEGEGEEEEAEETEEEREAREQRAAELEKAEVEREEKQVEEGDQDDRPPSLLWIIKKLSLMARREAANTPKIPLKRLCVFKFLGAVSMDLGPERLAPYLTPILQPLFRELHSTYAEQDPILKNLSQELIELLKKQVGLKTFSMAFSGVQKEFTLRRAARKRQRALQAVTNPDFAARKKMKKHKNKIQARKRKIEVMRPGYKAKKPRTQSLKNLAVLR